MLCLEQNWHRCPGTAATVLRNAERINNNNNKTPLNTSCIIQFLVSQGNRAERKKKIPEIWGFKTFSFPY